LSSPQENFSGAVERRLMSGIETRTIANGMPTKSYKLPGILGLFNGSRSSTPQLFLERSEEMTKSPENKVLFSFLPNSVTRQLGKATRCQCD
jgi:hypothetical protein